LATKVENTSAKRGKFENVVQLKKKFNFTM